ncbi:hypothetical protein [Streptomyces sp. NPDC056682]|uniref:hypothetical protein n=1 Tax=Streptomyces sp. NPDC056682 TaxID=3345909 RepID=UPI0036B1DD22
MAPHSTQRWPTRKHARAHGHLHRLVQAQVQTSTGPPDSRRVSGRNQLPGEALKDQLLVVDPDELQLRSHNDGSRARRGQHDRDHRHDHDITGHPRDRSCGSSLGTRLSGDQELGPADFFTEGTEDRYPDVFELLPPNGTTDRAAELLGVLPRHTLPLGHDPDANTALLTKITA